MTRPLSTLIAGWHRLTALGRRRRIARDLDDELAFHLEMLRGRLEREGVTRADAGRLARRQFGNVGVLKEETRDMWIFPSLESVMQDVTFAGRTLRRAPSYTAVAVLLLAIGIGANTAIFSLVDATLVQGLPYAAADRLVLLIGNVERARIERRGNSYPDHLDWSAQTTSFDGLAAFRGTVLTLFGDGEPARITAEGVSASYFELLRATPALGRTFTVDEDAVGRDPVTVLSHGLWQDRFGGDPGIVGRTVRLGTTTYDVIGVMPPGFVGIDDDASLWVPFTAAMPPAALESRGARGFFSLARLASGVSLAQAQTELDAISARLETEYPRTNEARGVEVSPLTVETFGEMRPVLLALMAAVGFVLLIACANVANLIISRSETRRREMAVRTALGAGWGRLLRQLVTESVVLAGLGGLAGLAVAWTAVPLLMATSPVDIPAFVTPTINASVLVFTLGTTVACGVLIGMAPALHSRWGRLGLALNGPARGSSQGASPVRGALMVAEVALAVVLLVGAGLMIRTTSNLAAIEPGYAVDPVLTLRVSVPRAERSAAETDAPPPFVIAPRVLTERLMTVPGVEAASLVSDMPLSGGGSAIFYAAEGDTTSDAQTMPRAYVHRITPEFFDTMGVDLIDGRTYRESELTDESTSIVVSRGVVDRFWPGENPIGKRIKAGRVDADVPWLTIVGVVPELKYRALPDNPTSDPDLYFPYVERGVQTVVLRTDVEPTSVVSAVRETLRAISPEVVIYDVAPLSERAAAMSAGPRFTAWLMGIFAATALLLSVVGIYGVMSYLVLQRTREFGIRLALGAGMREILGVVLRHGVRLVLVGLVVGIALATGLVRLVESLLFGVSSTDPSAVAAVTVLALAAMAACVIPALRASRVDPMVALRVD